MSGFDKRPGPSCCGNAEGAVHRLVIARVDAIAQKSDHAFGVILNAPKDQDRRAILRRGADVLPLAHAATFGRNAVTGTSPSVAALTRCKSSMVAFCFPPMSRYSVMRLHPARLAIASMECPGREAYSSNGCLCAMPSCNGWRDSLQYLFVTPDVTTMLQRPDIMQA